MLSANLCVSSPLQRNHFGCYRWGQGPYLPPDTLTAQRYRDFIETVLPGLLGNLTLAVRQGLWLGAPAHCGEDVRQ
jgi:hypothetical protein